MRVTALHGELIGIGVNFLSSSVLKNHEIYVTKTVNYLTPRAINSAQHRMGYLTAGIQSPMGVWKENEQVMVE
jgi:hypothetical protein